MFHTYVESYLKIIIMGKASFPLSMLFMKLMAIYSDDRKCHTKTGCISFLRQEHEERSPKLVPFFGTVARRLFAEVDNIFNAIIRTISSLRNRTYLSMFTFIFTLKMKNGDILGEKAITYPLIK